MNTKTICAALIAIAISTTSNAQHATNVSSTRATSRTTMAYARGNDSHLRFSTKEYDATKKYTVIKFWNANEPQSEQEVQDIAYLKKHLAKKNVEVIDFEWKTEEDLKQALEKYKLEAKVTGEKRINVKGEHFTVNTTSGKALLVMEDDKPFSICSGKDCESNLKSYFKLQSVN
jgi:hypothetical protein